MNQVQERQKTVYEEFKKASEITYNSNGKRLISKAGTIDDGLCPLSVDDVCQPSRDTPTVFLCSSHWWKSCPVYKKNGEMKE